MRTAMPLRSISKAFRRSMLTFLRRNPKATPRPRQSAAFSGFCGYLLLRSDKGKMPPEERFDVNRHRESIVPIYEYACGDCGREFETLVRSGSTPECPGCHSHSLAKKLSATAATG